MIQRVHRRGVDTAVRRAFQVWQQGAFHHTHRSHVTRSLVRRFRHRVLRNAMRMWHVQTSMAAHHKSVLKLCGKVFRSRVMHALNSAWRTWCGICRTEASQQQSLVRVLTHSRRRILRRGLRVWALLAVDITVGKAVLATVVGRMARRETAMAFKTWNNIVHGTNGHVLRDKVSEQLRRSAERRAVRRAMRMWHVFSIEDERTTKSREIAARLARSWVKACTRDHAREAFALWKTRTMMHLAAQARILTLHNRRLRRCVAETSLASALGRWKRGTKAVVAWTTRASALEKRWVRARRVVALQRWKMYVETVGGVERTLLQWQDRVQRRGVAVAFTQWRRVVDHLAKLERALFLVAKATTRRLLRRSVHRWVVGATVHRYDTHIDGLAANTRVQTLRILCEGREERLMRRAFHSIRRLGR